jgi:hypothetical protein
MKKFKVLTILLFALVIANVIIGNSSVLLPSNTNFVEYVVKRVPAMCRIEPKDDINELPLINVGNAQIGEQSTQADLSVVTEYSGSSMLWLKKTARNRAELNQMFAMPNLYISSIITALILWLFNEILKQTILLKEEQSLTI